MSQLLRNRVVSAKVRVRGTWNKLPVLGRDTLSALGTLALWCSAQRALVAGYAASSVPTAYTLAGGFCAIVLVLRRTAPLTGLLAGCVVYPALYRELVGEQVPLVSQFHLAPVLVSAYAVAVCGRLELGRTLLIALGGASALVVFPTGADDLSGCVMALVLSTTAVLLGHTMLRQRRMALALAARNDELERLRVLEAEQVVVAERTRIARELHDVVAHHVTAMVIRAQAADRVGDRDPLAARAAVKWIADSGQESLAAMRQIVRVLRTEERSERTEHSQDPERSPVGGGLGELHSTLDRVRAAGLQVDLELELPEGTLPPQVELSIVRIVQEALTNCLAHADATRAKVEVRRSPGCILLVVGDNGKNGVPPADRVEALPSPPAGSRSGHGLVGMQERAASCEGEVTLGTAAGGGWQITARFPREHSAGSSRP